MNNRIISDITNFIFVSDEPEKVDVFFYQVAVGDIKQYIL